MNIETLRECVDLASTLSFTETSRNFYIAQPVLSKHIASLESVIGIRIFLRTKNGIQLTNIGRKFVEDCHRIVSSYDEALENVRLMKSGIGQHIRIGYLQGAAGMFLPNAIRAFTKKHASEELQYLAMEIDEIPPAFESGDIDIAITSDLKPFNMDIYEKRALYRDAICIIVPKGHPLAAKEHLRLEDLTGSCLIVPRINFMATETMRINEIISPIMKSITTKKAIGDLWSIRTSILAEHSPAVEMMHLRHFFNDEELEFIPLDAPMPSFDVCVVWKKARETDALLEFVDEIVRASPTE